MISLHEALAELHRIISFSGLLITLFACLIVGISLLMGLDHPSIYLRITLLLFSVCRFNSLVFFCVFYDLLNNIWMLTKIYSYCSGLRTNRLSLEVQQRMESWTSGIITRYMAYFIVYSFCLVLKGGHCLVWAKWKC